MVVVVQLALMAAEASFLPLVPAGVVALLRL